MAFISRPGKEGNATTYQGKVAAGYTNILAQEVDADFDAIYSAWNAGVDTVNIKDGSVTTAKLAPGAVTGGTIGTGTIQTGNLADGSVTTPKLADGAVTAGKLVNGGAMGGDLTGNYPNPALSVIQSGAVQLGNGGRVVAIPQVIAVTMNDAGAAGTDPTKAQWALWLEGSADCLQVFRTQPGGSQAEFLRIDAAGYLHALLADLSVMHGQLAVNAPNGAEVHAQVPAGFVVPQPNVWTTVIALPSLTTRGGFVHLHANHCLTATGPVGGAFCNQRWLRDGTSIVEWPFQTGSFAPFPGLNLVDVNCPAGAHVYTYQVNAGTGCNIVGTSIADGLLQAVEIG